MTIAITYVVTAFIVAWGTYVMAERLNPGDERNPFSCAVLGVAWPVLAVFIAASRTLVFIVRRLR
jgi:hypothetical protein